MAGGGGAVHDDGCVAMVGRPRKAEGLRTPRIGAVSKSENGVRTILGERECASRDRPDRQLPCWRKGGRGGGRGRTQKQETVNLLLLLPCCRGERWTRRRWGQATGRTTAEGAAREEEGEDERTIFNGVGRIWRK